MVSHNGSHPDPLAVRLLLVQRWGFHNTYCMGKHLTEQLVQSYHGRICPCSIVRPTLVSAVAKEPYAGYVGNLAGALHTVHCSLP